MAHLEFDDAEGYLAFLKAKDISETHLDVHWVIGPRDERGAALITAYVVMSQQALGHVVQFRELVSEITTSCPLEERQVVMENVQRSLKDTKYRLQDLGFQVHAGIWKS